MSDDIEFEIDAAAKGPIVGSDLARKEQAQIEQPPKPNSIVISLWGKSHISFEPENSVQIFAILALVLLAVTCTIVAICSIFAQPNASWPEKALTVLGSVIASIVGAMVGSSATSSRPKSK